MAPAGAVAGPALQVQQGALWAGWVYALVALGAALLVASVAALRHSRAGGNPGLLSGALGPRLRGGDVVVCLAVASMAFSLAGLRATAYLDAALDSALEGRDITITGVVASMPQRSDNGIRFRFEVESARIGRSDVKLPPLLQLGWYSGWLASGDTAELQRATGDLQPGERWQMTVRLKAPHGNVNPHGFDYELWLWEQGVQATGYVRAGPKDPSPQRIGSTWAHPLERARHAVRERILDRVADRKLAGVIAALVVGDQAAIDRADWDVFRATGVAHLMSISGLHVTMFAWLAAAVVGALWRRSGRLCLRVPAQHAALWGGLALATLYAMFSGWGVPSQRTIWMLGTVGLLRLSARQWPWPVVWLLACAVVVTIDPWALLQAGFWLSFVAVGVLFATDVGARPAQVAGMATRFAGMTGRLLREQAVVTLALAPLSLLLFNQVSIVGLVANLGAIPWVTLVVTPLAMAGVFAPLAWDAAACAVDALGIVLQWLATLPLATVSVAAAPLWAGIAGVVGGLLLAMPWPLWLRALGVPLLLPVLLWQPVRPATGEFELLAADVGQGNAVLVRTATHTLVYDAGPRYGPDSDAGHRVLVPLLRSLDEHVATLVLSHRDSDHTGGGAAILAMQPQAALLSSIEAGHELQALRPAQRCEAGQRWTWDGVGFEVLHPVPATYEGTPKPNAVSCVLRVANGRVAALLAGDIEQPQEARLVADAAPLQADVLLVPHHGSKTSSSATFLEAVRPAIGLVQAGYRNRFGHPAPPVVERLREHGLAIVDSPRCGAATWRSTEPARVDCERTVARRYWRHRPP